MNRTSSGWQVAEESLNRPVHLLSRVVGGALDEMRESYLLLQSVPARAGRFTDADDTNDNVAELEQVYCCWLECGDCSNLCRPP